MSFGGGASLGSASGEIVLNVDRAQANVKQLQGTINQFGASAGDSLNRVATGLGLLAAARGIGGLFTGAVGDAADFESQISAIGAVTGETGTQLDALRDKALQLGKDTAFSASEAAGALEELAKAGVSVEDILNGAADGATALAAAGGVGIPQAATTIATALNQFGLAGDEATHVADLIAAASSTSSAGVLDIGEALSYVGTTAASLNIPIEDTITSIAALADVGVVGSRAGTAIGSAFSSLSAPTDKARAAMDAIGLSAYDASGNFKALPTLIEDIAKATADMSEEQRNAALQGIFDEQGLRAVNALLKTQEAGADAAGKSWKDYAANVNVAGAASDQAEKRLDNFKGSLEQLRGSIETAAIMVGTLFLPVLREIVDAATAAVNAFIGLPEPLQAIAAGAGVAAAAMAGIAGAMVLIGPRMAEFGQALAVVRKAMFGLVAANPALLALIATVALFGIAYKTNFGGFGDFVDDKLSFVQRRFGYFTKGFGKTFKGLDRVFKGKPFTEKFFSSLGIGLRDALGIQGRAADAFIQKFNAIGRVASGFEQGVGRMSGALGDISRIIQRDGLAEGIDRLFGDKGRDLIRGFGESLGTLPKVFGGLLGAITTGIGPLDSILANAGRGFEHFGGAIEALFDGDFSLAGERLRNALDRAIDAALTGLDLVRDVGEFVLNATVRLATNVVGAFWDWAVDQIMGRGSAGGLTGGGHGAGPSQQEYPVGEVLLTAAARLGGLILNVVGRLYEWVKEQLFGSSGGSGLTGGGHGASASGGIDVPLGTVILSGAADLGGVLEEIAGNVWGWVKDQFNNLLDASVPLGTALITASADLAGDIATVAGDVWAWVKGQFNNLLDASVPLGTALISAAASLGGTLAEIAPDVWGWVKKQFNNVLDAVIPLGDAIVSIGKWTAAESEAGTLVASVKTKADELLASAGIEITDFKLTIGALGIENVDFKGVTDFFTKPIEFPAGTAESASAWGYKIGDAIQSLIRAAVNSIGSGGGAGAPTTADIIGHGTATDSLGDVASEFIGGLIEGLIVNITATIDKEIAAAKARLTEVVAPVREFFGDIGAAITGAFSGGGGQVDNRSGQQLGGTDSGSIITNLIAGIFDFELPTFNFPDLVTPVTTWVTTAIGDIKAAFSPPEWLKKLAGGDVIGAIKSLGMEDTSQTRASTQEYGRGETAQPVKGGRGGGAPSSLGGGGAEGGGFQGTLAAEGFLTTYGDTLGAGLPGKTDVAFNGARPAMLASASSTGGVVGPGMLDAIDLTSLGAKLSAPFANAGPNIAEASRGIGATAGDNIAAGIASKIPTIQANIRTALAAASSGGSAPTQQGGAPPKAAQTAPPPVIIPAPNLTLYVAGLATAVLALRTTIGVLGLVAQGLAIPLGAAAGAATVAFNAAIGVGFTTAVQATITAVGVIGVVAQGVIAPLGSAAASGMAAFYGALGSGFGVAFQVMQAGLGTLSGIASGFSLYAEGNAIGSSLGSGIAIGIASSAGVVAAAAAGVVNVAAQAARNAAQIASPSRLFARTIGVPIGQGVAVGITSTRPLVNTSMANLIGGIPAQSVSTAQLIGSQATGRTSGAGGGNTYVRVINAVKSDEMQRLIAQAEKGGAVFDYMEELPRAMTTVRSGG